MPISVHFVNFSFLQLARIRGCLECQRANLFLFEKSAIFCRLVLPGGGKWRFLLGGSRFDLPSGGELRFLDPLGGSRSDLPGGGESELCDLIGGSRSIFFLVVAQCSSSICSVEADRLCPVVACWSLFVDLFGCSRSVLPSGGIVKSLICSVAADRTCPVVA